MKNKPTIEKFFNTCFDAEDYVWVASKEMLGSKCYAKPQESVVLDYADKQFSGGAYLAINAGVDRRLLENVTKARTLLVEFDDIPVDEQLNLWKSVKLPCTAIISSGGKSVHFWITLEDCLQKGEYKEWFLRIWLLLSKKNDKQCSDASRYSRFPTVYRDTKQQKLMFVGKRIPNMLLKNRLFNSTITKEYESLFANKNTGDTVYVRGDKVPIDTAIKYLNTKYPLITGNKQSALIVWARYLFGSAGITDEETICNIIQNNDQGSDKLYHEYQRVAHKVIGNYVPSTKINDSIWSGVNA